MFSGIHRELAFERLRHPELKRVALFGRQDCPLQPEVLFSLCHDERQAISPPACENTAFLSANGCREWQVLVFPVSQPTDCSRPKSCRWTIFHTSAPSLTFQRRQVLVLFDRTRAGKLMGCVMVSGSPPDSLCRNISHLPEVRSFRRGHQTNRNSRNASNLPVLMIASRILAYKG